MRACVCVRERESARVRVFPPPPCSVLAREMFNPSYALFTPSVDSPTFQPNPLSFINGDHLFYFKFVGRIIGTPHHTRPH